MQLEEILQFEKNAENVMIGVLESACPNVYRSNMDDVNRSPRLTCKAIVGAQFQNQMLPIASSPGYLHSAYECRLEVTATTNRTTESKSNALDELVGQARMRCSQFYVDAWQMEQLNADSTSLPNFVTQLKPTENEKSEQDAENLDNLKLSFDSILVINPCALPTSI